MNLKIFGAVLVTLTALMFNPAVAQEAPVADRTATGGAQTLADIMARQNRMEVDESFRSENLGDPANAAQASDQLGTLGGTSVADDYRAIRYNKIDPTTQVRGPAVGVFIQDGGMPWYELREGPMITYGGGAIIGMILLLALFYFTRGKIMIGGSGPAGTTIERFKAIERFGHWLLSGSFVALGLTGLITLMGRSFLIPVLGPEGFSTLAIASKWVHNNIAWAFMLGLVLTFVMWVKHNIPNKLDWQWIKQGGGFIGNGHPSAKKFNAGQKIVFWMVMVLGLSVSLSGLSLLFPFEIPMFASTFELINSILGTDFPTVLAPHEEMQYANIWHSIVAFVMMVAILAHIYIGSVGMEGAFAAMGDGQVDLEWARQHHDLWVEEVQAKQGKGGSS